MQRKVAFPRVMMPDGTILRREVIIFNSQGTPVEHYPLTAEEAFVEWYNCSYRYGDKF